MQKHVANFYRDEEGATAIEYGLIAALVAAAAFGALISFGNSVNQMYTYVSSNFSTAATP